jgi:AraC-like DNA-binding protein
MRFENKKEIIKPDEQLNFNGLDLYKRLYRAKEFIDDCYDKPIDLNRIAGQAYFSPFHFLRVFKKIYNKTPHQYLTERRIEKAKELLSKDDLRVTDVCFEVGFQSVGSFSTLFNKYVGYPPAVYKLEYLRKLQVAIRFPEKVIPACFLQMYRLS